MGGSIREEIQSTVHLMGEKIEERMDMLEARLCETLLEMFPPRGPGEKYGEVTARIELGEFEELTPRFASEREELKPRFASEHGINLCVGHPAPMEDVLGDTLPEQDDQPSAPVLDDLSTRQEPEIPPPRPDTKTWNPTRSFSEGSLASKSSLASSANSQKVRGVMQNIAETARERRRSSSSSLTGLFVAVVVRTRNRPPWQKTLWQFLEDPDLVRGGRTLMNVISAFILLSVIMPILQTIEGGVVSALTEVVIEVVLDCVFVIETGLRLFCCPNRVNFLFSIYNLIDLVAAFLPLALHASAMDMRIGQTEHSAEMLILLTAIPILRLMKLVRRFETFHLLTKALRDALEALPMLLFTLTVIVLFFASCIYVLEPRHNVRTMGQALWFSIVTVGTVGYGEIVPETVGGLFVSSALIVVSALYMAIPLGIVGEAFSRVWKDRDRLLLVHRTQIRFLNTGYRAEDIPPMFCGWDNDGDGMVTLPEFMNMMKQMELDMPSHRLVDLFQTFDRDGNGTIDDQEFVRTLFPEAYAELYSALETAEVTEQRGDDEESRFRV